MVEEDGLQNRMRNRIVGSNPSRRAKIFQKNVEKYFSDLKTDSIIDLLLKNTTEFFDMLGQISEWRNW